MSKTFEFRGTGFGYLWLLIWTSFVSVITLGLYFPWAYSALQRWIADNTYVNDRQLVFTGSGIQFLGHWLLIMILTFITLGLICPLGLLPVKALGDIEYLFCR